MITALPIKGKLLCMSTDSEGWRQQMEALIGMSPPEPEVEDGRKKDRVPADAPFTWIAANFARSPKDANDDVIETYARVYMWYVIPRTIFADGTGKNAQWMWPKALTVFDNKFSWGWPHWPTYTDTCTKLVVGPQEKMELVVVCSYFRYGAGNAFLLGALERLDRRRQRKIKDWNKHHKKYVTIFEQSVEAARSTQGTQAREHCPLAFNSYVRWFQENTRVEIFPLAYEEDILEDPTSFYALAMANTSGQFTKGTKLLSLQF
ncbi:Disease resistance protein RPM1 [Hordeum vulgare]|nr:Disease resistance protein RPM1 [Hordeum vulgare]